MGGTGGGNAVASPTVGTLGSGGGGGRGNTDTGWTAGASGGDGFVYITPLYSPE